MCEAVVGPSSYTPPPIQVPSRAPERRLWSPVAAAGRHRQAQCAGSRPQAFPQWVELGTWWLWELEAGEWGRVGAPKHLTPQPIPQSQGSAHRTPGSRPLSPLAISQGGATSEGAGSVFGHPARPPGTTCSGPTGSPSPAGKGKFAKHGGQVGRVLAPPPGCQQLLVKGWHFC